MDEKTLDQQYDDKLKATLEVRLGRPAKQNEIINSDNDSDLVNEVLWQIICELNKRVSTLENGGDDKEVV